MSSVPCIAGALSFSSPQWWQATEQNEDDLRVLLSSPALWCWE